MFEQFKVLTEMIEGEKRKKRWSNEHDPCENNEYKDTLEKSIRCGDIESGRMCDAIWYEYILKN